MSRTKYKSNFKPWMRFVALALVIAFLWQDVVWANPEIGSPKTATLAQPTLATNLNKQESYRRWVSFTLEREIRNALIKGQKPTLSTVENLLPYLKSAAKSFGVSEPEIKGHNLTGAIKIEFEDGNDILYYNPNLSPEHADSPAWDHQQNTGKRITEDKRVIDYDPEDKDYLRAQVIKNTVKPEPITVSEQISVISDDDSRFAGDPISIAGYERKRNVVSTLELPGGLTRTQSTRAANPIAQFVIEKAGKLSAKEEFDIRLTVVELASNIMRHGNGGTLSIYIEKNASNRTAKLKVVSSDNETGLPQDPNELLKRSIKTHEIRNRKIPGWGFYSIGLLPDQATIEYNGDLWERISSDRRSKKWFECFEGSSDVVSGTRFTLEFDLSQEEEKSAITEIPESSSVEKAQTSKTVRGLSKRKRTTRLTTIISLIAGSAFGSTPEISGSVAILSVLAGVFLVAFFLLTIVLFSFYNYNRFLYFLKDKYGDLKEHIREKKEISRKRKLINRAESIVFYIGTDKWGEILSRYPLIIKTLLLSCKNLRKLTIVLPEEYRGLFKRLGDQRVETVTVAEITEDFIDTEQPDLFICSSAAVTSSDVLAKFSNEENTIESFGYLAHEEKSRKVITYAERIRWALKHIFKLITPSKSEPILKRDESDKKIVFINPICITNEKRFLENVPAALWVEVVEELWRRGYKVVLNGGPTSDGLIQEPTRAIYYALRYKFGNDLPDDLVKTFKDKDECMEYFSSEVKAVVTVDTGIFHLAQVFGIPNVVITTEASNYWVSKAGKKDTFRPVDITDFLDNKPGVIADKLGEALEAESVMGEAPFNAWQSWFASVAVIAGSWIAAREKKSNTRKPGYDRKAKIKELFATLKEHNMPQDAMKHESLPKALRAIRKNFKKKDRKKAEELMLELAIDLAGEGIMPCCVLHPGVGYIARVFRYDFEGFETAVYLLKDFALYLANQKRLVYWDTFVYGIDFLKRKGNIKTVGEFSNSLQVLGHMAADWYEEFKHLDLSSDLAGDIYRTCYFKFLIHVLQTILQEEKSFNDLVSCHRIIDASLLKVGTKLKDAKTASKDLAMMYHFLEGNAGVLPEDYCFSMAEFKRTWRMEIDGHMLKGYVDDAGGFYEKTITIPDIDGLLAGKEIKLAHFGKYYRPRHRGEFWSFFAVSILFVIAIAIESCVRKKPEIEKDPPEIELKTSPEKGVVRKRGDFVFASWITASGKQSDTQKNPSTKRLRLVLKRVTRVLKRIRINRTGLILTLMLVAGSVFAEGTNKVSALIGIDPAHPFSAQNILISPFLSMVMLVVYIAIFVLGARWVFKEIFVHRKRIWNEIGEKEKERKKAREREKHLRYTKIRWAPGFEAHRLATTEDINKYFVDKEFYTDDISYVERELKRTDRAKGRSVRFYVVYVAESPDLENVKLEDSETKFFEHEKLPIGIIRVDRLEGPSANGSGPADVILWRGFAGKYKGIERYKDFSDPIFDNIEIPVELLEVNAIKNVILPRHLTTKKVVKERSYGYRRSTEEAIAQVPVAFTDAELVKTKRILDPLLIRGEEYTYKGEAYFSFPEDDLDLARFEYAGSAFNKYRERFWQVIKDPAYRHFKCGEIPAHLLNFSNYVVLAGFSYYIGKASNIAGTIVVITFLWGHILAPILASFTASRSCENHYQQEKADVAAAVNENRGGSSHEQEFDITGKEKSLLMRISLGRILYLCFHGAIAYIAKVRFEYLESVGESVTEEAVFFAIIILIANIVSHLFNAFWGQHWMRKLDRELHLREKAKGTGTGETLWQIMGYGSSLSYAIALTTFFFTKYLFNVSFYAGAVLVVISMCISVVAGFMFPRFGQRHDSLMTIKAKNYYEETPGIYRINGSELRIRVKPGEEDGSQESPLPIAKYKNEIIVIDPQQVELIYPEGADVKEELISLDFRNIRTLKHLVSISKEEGRWMFGHYEERGPFIRIKDEAHPDIPEVKVHIYGYKYKGSTEEKGISVRKIKGRYVGIELDEDAKAKVFTKRDVAWIVSILGSATAFYFLAFTPLINSLRPLIANQSMVGVFQYLRNLFNLIKGTPGKERIIWPFFAFAGIIASFLVYTFLSSLLRVFSKPLKEHKIMKTTHRKPQQEEAGWDEIDPWTGMSVHKVNEEEVERQKKEIVPANETKEYLLTSHNVTSEFVRNLIGIEESRYPELTAIIKAINKWQKRSLIDKILDFIKGRRALKAYIVYDFKAANDERRLLGLQVIRLIRPVLPFFANRRSAVVNFYPAQSNILPDIRIADTGKIPSWVRNVFIHPDYASLSYGKKNSTEESLYNYKLEPQEDMPNKAKKLKEKIGASISIHDIDLGIDSVKDGHDLADYHWFRQDRCSLIRSTDYMVLGERLSRSNRFEDWLGFSIHSILLPTIATTVGLVVLNIAADYFHVQYQLGFMATPISLITLIALTQYYQRRPTEIYRWQQRGLAQEKRGTAIFKGEMSAADRNLRKRWVGHLWFQIPLTIISLITIFWREIMEFFRVSVDRLFSIQIPPGPGPWETTIFVGMSLIALFIAFAKGPYFGPADERFHRGTMRDTGAFKEYGFDDNWQRFTKPRAVLPQWLALCTTFTCIGLVAMIPKPAGAEISPFVYIAGLIATLLFTISRPLFAYFASYDDTKLTVSEKWTEKKALIYKDKSSKGSITELVYREETATKKRGIEYMRIRPSKGEKLILSRDEEFGEGDRTIILDPAQSGLQIFFKEGEVEEPIYHRWNTFNRHHSFGFRPFKYANEWGRSYEIPRQGKDSLWLYLNDGSYEYNVTLETVEENSREWTLGYRNKLVMSAVKKRGPPRFIRWLNKRRIIFTSILIGVVYAFLMDLSSGFATPANPWLYASRLLFRITYLGALGGVLSLSLLRSLTKKRILTPTAGHISRGERKNAPLGMAGILRNFLIRLDMNEDRASTLAGRFSGFVEEPLFAGIAINLLIYGLNNIGLHVPYATFLYIYAVTSIIYGFSHEHLYRWRRSGGWDAQRRILYKDKDAVIKDPYPATTADKWRFALKGAMFRIVYLVPGVNLLAALIAAIAMHVLYNNVISKYTNSALAMAGKKTSLNEKIKALEEKVKKLEKRRDYKDILETLESAISPEYMKLKRACEKSRWHKRYLNEGGRLLILRDRIYNIQKEIKKKVALIKKLLKTKPGDEKEKVAERLIIIKRYMGFKDGEIKPWAASLGFDPAMVGLFLRGQKKQSRPFLRELEKRTGIACGLILFGRELETLLKETERGNEGRSVPEKQKLKKRITVTRKYLCLSLSMLAEKLMEKYVYQINDTTIGGYEIINDPSPVPPGYACRVADVAGIDAALVLFGRKLEDELARVKKFKDRLEKTRYYLRLFTIESIEKHTGYKADSYYTVSNTLTTSAIKISRKFSDMAGIDPAFILFGKKLLAEEIKTTEHLGDRVRKTRIWLGFSNNDLREALKKKKIKIKHSQTISLWEGGRIDQESLTAVEELAGLEKGSLSHNALPGVSSESMKRRAKIAQSFRVKKTTPSVKIEDVFKNERNINEETLERKIQFLKSRSQRISEEVKGVEELETLQNIMAEIVICKAKKDNLLGEHGFFLEEERPELLEALYEAEDMLNSAGIIANDATNIFIEELDNELQNLTEVIETIEREHDKKTWFSAENNMAWIEPMERYLVAIDKIKKIDAELHARYQEKYEALKKRLQKAFVASSKGESRPKPGTPDSKDTYGGALKGKDFENRDTSHDPSHAQSGAPGITHREINPEIKKLLEKGKGTTIFTMRCDVSPNNIDGREDETYRDLREVIGNDLPLLRSVPLVQLGMREPLGIIPLDLRKVITNEPVLCLPDLPDEIEIVLVKTPKQRKSALFLKKGKPVAIQVAHAGRGKDEDENRLVVYLDKNFIDDHLDNLQIIKELISEEMAEELARRNEYDARYVHNSLITSGQIKNLYDEYKRYQPYRDILGPKPNFLHRDLGRAIGAKNQNVASGVTGETRTAESIHKDYFEMVFKHHLNLFVLLAKRIRAKQTSGESGLRRAEEETAGHIRQTWEDIERKEKRRFMYLGAFFSFLYLIPGLPGRLPLNFLIGAHLLYSLGFSRWFRLPVAMASGKNNATLTQTDNGDGSVLSGGPSTNSENAPATLSKSAQELPPTPAEGTPLGSDLEASRSANTEKPSSGIAGAMAQNRPDAIADTGSVSQDGVARKGPPLSSVESPIMEWVDGKDEKRSLDSLPRKPITQADHPFENIKECYKYLIELIETVERLDGSYIFYKTGDTICSMRTGMAITHDLRNPLSRPYNYVLPELESGEFALISDLSWSERVRVITRETESFRRKFQAWLEVYNEFAEGRSLEDLERVKNKGTKKIPTTLKGTLPVGFYRVFCIGKRKAQKKAILGEIISRMRDVIPQFESCTRELEIALREKYKDQDIGDSGSSSDPSSAIIPRRQDAPATLSESAQELPPTPAEGTPLGSDLKTSLNDTGFDWANAEECPWKEMVRDERRDDRPRTMRQRNYQKNNIAIRKKFLKFLKKEDYKDFKKFKKHLANLHKILIRGERNLAPYIPSWRDQKNRSLRQAWRVYKKTNKFDYITDERLKVVWSALKKFMMVQPGTLDRYELAQLVSEFYISAMTNKSDETSTLFGAGRGNNSLMMNLANAMMRLHGINGIQHREIDLHLGARFMKPEILAGIILDDDEVSQAMREAQTNKETQGVALKTLVEEFAYPLREAIKEGRLKDAHVLTGYFIDTAASVAHAICFDSLYNSTVETDPDPGDKSTQRYLEEKIGSMDDIRDMDFDEFAEKIGVIEVENGLPDGIALASPHVMALLDNIRRLAGNGDYDKGRIIIEKEIAQGKSLKNKDETEQFWTFNTAKEGEDIFLCRRMCEEKGIPLTKSIIYRKLLEKSYITSGLYGIWQRGGIFNFRYEDFTLVTKELKFASKVGELEVVLKYWNTQLQRAKSQRAEIKQLMSKGHRPTQKHAVNSVSVGVLKRALEPYNNPQEDPDLADIDNDAESHVVRAALEGERRATAGKKTSFQTIEQIETNVKEIVPYLAHFLMYWNKGGRTEFPEAKPEIRKRKVVIFDLPSEKAEKARNLFEHHVIKSLKRMKANNGTIAKVLEEMDTFGREKIGLVRQRIRDESLDSGDVIIVTDKSRLDLFKKGEFEGSSKTALDAGEKFNWETQYYPYVEAALFAVLMGLVNDYYEDEELRQRYKELLWKWYAHIPNVQEIDKNALISMCFESDGITPKKEVILKLIPDAARFDPDELQKLYERIGEFIKSA